VDLLEQAIDPLPKNLRAREPVEHADLATAVDQDKRGSAANGALNRDVGQITGNFGCDVHAPKWRLSALWCAVIVIPNTPLEADARFAPIVLDDD
jgi:hypothetical protein